MHVVTLFEVLKQGFQKYEARPCL